jgi:uncharacterized Fe-S center protein
MAKVYFTSFKTKPEIGMLKKLKTLLETGKFTNSFEKDNMVALKIHFGEYGNLAYIRPNYLRVIVDLIKANAGKPFLTDTNTLYKGSRSNAIDHLETAVINGFAKQVVDAPLIIADGLRGTDEIKIPVDGDYIKEAKIGAAIAHSETIISVNHFKGHEQAGFGGAIKNLGMGCASRAGKMEQHSTSKPRTIKENCVKCQLCARNCPMDAITIDEYAIIDYDKCIGCGQCVAMCNYGAIVPVWNESADQLCKKMAEYALAVLKDKKSFHISFINNVSPNCDCWSSNDIPISPDIGIVVSTDPVALDQACIDLVIKEVGHDPFTEVHPRTDWSEQLAHAEKIGLGKREYELVKVGF